MVLRKVLPAPALLRSPTGEGGGGRCWLRMAGYPSNPSNPSYPSNTSYPSNACYPSHPSNPSYPVRF